MQNERRRGRERASNRRLSRRTVNKLRVAMLRRGRSTLALERMRAVATFGALSVLWTAGILAATSANSSLPDGNWKLQVCMSVSYTTSQPCAYIDQDLILRVERPPRDVSPIRQKQVTFEQKVSRELALRIYSGTVEAIHSCDAAHQQPAPDANMLTMVVTTVGRNDQLDCYGVDDATAGRGVLELIRVLNDSTRGAF